MSVVVYRVTWQNGAVLSPPKPVSLSEAAAENVLKHADERYPMWVAEQDLAKYGFELSKEEQKEETPKKPAAKKAKKDVEVLKDNPLTPQKEQSINEDPFLQSVEDLESNN